MTIRFAFLAPVNAGGFRSQRTQIGKTILFSRAVEWSFLAFLSMRAVCLFLRARVVIM